MFKGITLATLSLLLLLPGAARAHCDTLDGPVVQTARQALASGKVNPVLAWVRAQDEGEVRQAFARALAVRGASPAARELADTWFFETVARVHRAGEGAPYTGLKPAGQDLGPAVPAADRALEKGSPEAVERILVEQVKSGLHARYARVRAQKPPAQDVAAGRAWVEAYVPYVHYVEGVYEAAKGKAGAHAEPAVEADAHPAPAHGHAAHAHD